MCQNGQKSSFDLETFECSNIERMKRLLVYLILVAAAIVCYFVGFGEEILPLMIAYIVIEIIIGSRLGAGLRRKQQRS